MERTTTARRTRRKNLCIAFRRARCAVVVNLSDPEDAQTNRSFSAARGIELVDRVVSTFEVLGPG